MTNDLLSTLTDRDTMDLFLAVAESNGKYELYISKLNLTRKQFYTRMMKLRNADLVIRNGGTVYKLTSFGMVVRKIVEMIEHADKHLRWKHTVIDNTEDLELRQKLHDNLFTEQDKKLELVCIQR